MDRQGSVALWLWEVMGTSDHMYRVKQSTLQYKCTSKCMTVSKVICHSRLLVKKQSSPSLWVTDTASSSAWAPLTVSKHLLGDSGPLPCLPHSGREQGRATIQLEHNSCHMEGAARLGIR